MYRNAFSYQKMGYAATLGLALAVIIAAVLVVQRMVIGRQEEA
jgi:ABC-type sugar transport system permease subunit